MSAVVWERGWASLPPERRRVRAMVSAAVLFAAVVLLTSFPASEVVSQRAALSSAAHELSSLDAANRVLAAQASALSDPATVQSLARHDYGFVGQGDRAYDILPAPGADDPTSTSSGYVPLDASPVVPGSARSQALLGVDTPASPGPSHGADARPGAGDAGEGDGGDGVTTAHPGPPPGYWGRVLRSLEFWN